MCLRSCRGEEEGWIGEAQGMFQGNKTNLFATVMVDKCPYAFLKPVEIYNTMCEP